MAIKGNSGVLGVEDEETVAVGDEDVPDEVPVEVGFGLDE